MVREYGYGVLEVQNCGKTRIPIPTPIPVYLFIGCPDIITRLLDTGEKFIVTMLTSAERAATTFFMQLVSVFIGGTLANGTDH